MATAMLAPPDSPVATAQLWRLSVARYHEMLAAGLLTPADRLELLEGYLVEKMTVNPPHAFVTETIREQLGRLLPAGFFVSAQQPITLADSEPEPDVMVVQGVRREFVQNHPRPWHIPLVIEVADTSLIQDRTWKKRIYARAGIPVYWLVNLPEQQIEQYTQPSGDSDHPTYHSLTTYHLGDTIPLILDTQPIATLPVTDLLP
jgi:Uma2 family endonuclease